MQIIQWIAMNSRVLYVVATVALLALMSGCCSAMVREKEFRYGHPKTEISDKVQSGHEVLGSMNGNKNETIYEFSGLIDNNRRRIIQIDIPREGSQARMREIRNKTEEIDSALLVYTTSFSPHDISNPEIYKEKYKSVSDKDVVILYTLAREDYFYVYIKKRREDVWSKYTLSPENVAIEWEERSKIKHNAYRSLYVVTPPLDVVTFPFLLMIGFWAAANGA